MTLRINRNDIAQIITRWCVANGEEFLPNPLADQITAFVNGKLALPDEEPSGELVGEVALILRQWSEKGAPVRESRETAARICALLPSDAGLRDA